MSSSTPNEWTELSMEKGSDCISLTLPSGSDNYKVMELSMPKKFTMKDAAAAADIVYDHANRTQVALLFHQHNRDPKRSRIQCVANDRVEEARQKMTEDGFTYGVQTSSVFRLRDGQDIHIFFSGNIARNSNDEGLLKMMFFSNFRQTVQEVNLAVVNTFQQTGHAEYRGTLTCHVMEPGDIQSAERRTEYTVTLAITLPKPRIVVDPPYYMKALSVFLATKLVRPDGTNWDAVKSITGVSFDALFRRAHNETNEEDKCAVLLYEWVKESIGLLQNPVDEIGKSLFDQIIGIVIGQLSVNGLDAIEKQCVAYIQIQKDQLSDEKLKKMISKWHGDIFSVGQSLGLTNHRMQQCLQGVPGNPQCQLLVLLQEWRVSKHAAKSGSKAVEALKAVLLL